MNFTPKKNTGLGKGLSALIPSDGLRSDGTLKHPEGTSTSEIPLNSIRANPFQPRKEFDAGALEDLKNSILTNGIIQPITVRKTTSGYELIAGERRFRAAKMAKLQTVPAYVREKVSDEEMLELAIIENVQREKLNPIELAEGYQQLITVCELTQDEVARKIGKDRTTITNILRLLKLPADVQGSLKKEEITIGHGRALVALPDAGTQIKVWRQVVESGLSVRKTEQVVKAIVDRMSGKGSKKSAGRLELATVEMSDPHLADIENRLRIKLGTKVKVKHRGDTGTVEVEYYSLDDLERLIDLIESIG
ncbi:MAG: ParB/RepB/Spo0J family partition protein [Bacteroidetes bacterium]|nr:ParB/RepB/Spo0J family partition protein [Bacteroidota bacterium]